jgi:hypothetical protein
MATAGSVLDLGLMGLAVGALVMSGVLFAAAWRDRLVAVRSGDVARRQIARANLMRVLSRAGVTLAMLGALVAHSIYGQMPPLGEHVLFMVTLGCIWLTLIYEWRTRHVLWRQYHGTSRESKSALIRRLRALVSRLWQARRVRERP